MRPIEKYMKASLKVKMIVFTTVMVAVLISIIGGFSLWYINNSIENTLAKNSMEVAQKVVLNRDIQVNIGKPRGEYRTQLIVEDIRRASNAAAIAVMDVNGIQYAYSAFNKIGGKDINGNSSMAYDGKTYISKSTKGQERYVQAHMPIYRDGKQVGIVLVSMAMPNITKFFTEVESGFYFILTFSILLTIMGATMLAQNIKRQISGLEPLEISRLLKERYVILQTVKEGILAVDSEYKITLINGEGKRILGLKEDVIGRDIREIIKHSHMPEIIEKGIPEYDREHILNNRAIVANTLPINIGGEAIGAVSSFRDLTEVKNLAEQMTGVRRFIDALRAQNHEFLNKMHTISGLLQLKCYDEAMKYIDDISSLHEETLGFLTKHIKNPSLSGLLLAKYNKMEEMKIKFSIDPCSRVAQGDEIDTEVLLTVIGNLIENAIDAVSGLDRERKNVYLTINDGSEELEIIVTDTGEGIPEENLEKIFEFGFSTKEGANKGVGLALIRQILEGVGGTIHVESQMDVGTEMIVIIPKK
ncbi:ATP-binding protein [Anaerosolibacter sp.]|uniref:ATP-binding protein n=1 Tax=Anaerosolibacter sp. TaxID=1872527 RepID=UPI0039EDEE25